MTSVDWVVQVERKVTDKFPVHENRNGPDVLRQTIGFSIKAESAWDTHERISIGCNFAEHGGATNVLYEFGGEGPDGELMRSVVALAAILPAFALAASAASAAETGKYCLKVPGASFCTANKKATATSACSRG
jgi:hypothetical protein